MHPSTVTLAARARKCPQRVLIVLAAAVLLVGCGGSDPTDVTEPDPDVAPFVGTWEAVVFEVTNLADQDQVLDVVAIGSFSLNVQPSGFYTATLVVEESLNVENGQLTVIGNSIRLGPTDGQATTAEYAFLGPNRVELNGPTEFDFNFDGEPETARARIILERT
jgi:hypothetical protein